MSQDPNYGYGYTPEPPPGVPPGYPPPGAPDLTVVRQRVQVPAIFLIVVGVLNLFLGGCGGLVGFRFSSMSEDQFEQLMNQNPQYSKMLDDLHKEGWTTRDILNTYQYSGLGEGIAGLVTALLAIVGGACMLALRGYVLAVFSSIVTAIPFLSCAACCGLGEVAGIWAFIVLMNAEVRSAFR